METSEVITHKDKDTKTPEVVHKGYEKGDSVRLFREPTKAEAKGAGWIDQFRTNVGQVGIVIDNTCEGLDHTFVNLNGERAYYPNCVLIKQIDYQIGDLVRVTRAPLECEMKDAFWAPGMDSQVGTIAEVTRIGAHKNSYVLQFIGSKLGNGLQWTYIDFLLEPAPTVDEVLTNSDDSQFKPGDIVKIKEESPESVKAGLWTESMRKTTIGKVGRVRAIDKELIAVSVHTEQLHWYRKEDLRQASKWNKKKYLEDSESSK